jgi:hypothetical protein
MATAESEEGQGDPSPESLPEEYMVGDSLDWRSERVRVELSVELPFWLMVPDGVVDLGSGRE